MRELVTSGLGLLWTARELDDGRTVNCNWTLARFRDISPIVFEANCLIPQRLASEIVFIDINENLAKAEAEDIGHVAAFLGNPKIEGTKGMKIFNFYFFSSLENK